MNKKVKSTAYYGIVGSLLMFMGDMLLYYTSEPFQNIHEQLLISMGNVPLARFFAGGAIAPFATIFYVIGFYHLLYRVDKKHQKAAYPMFYLFVIAFVVGACFHAFFPAFGIVAHNGYPDLVFKLFQYAKVLASICFTAMALAWIWFDVLVVMGRTSLPKYWILFSPVITFWLTYLWDILPAPFAVILAGGWVNLTHFIAFLTMLLMVAEKRKTA